MNVGFFLMGIVMLTPRVLTQMGVIFARVMMVSLAMEGHASVCGYTQPVKMCIWHACLYYNIDIDECTAGLDNCGVNADCIDTIGSYTCQCKPMFFESADGNNCIGLTITLSLIDILTC